MDLLEELASYLKKFPGIGSKSARRIALYLIRQDEEYLSGFAELLSRLKKDLHTCEQCGNISSRNPCNICSDPLRDRKTLCIVEDIEALSAFEQAGIYNGLYHVLGRAISPYDGGELNNDDIEFLNRHISSLKPNEVIIATNPKFEGDIMYYTLRDVLNYWDVKKITRLAYGLPVGGTIEFADRITLHAALEARRQL